MKSLKKYIITFSLILLAITPSLFSSAKKEVMEKDEPTSQIMEAEYHKIDPETAQKAFDSQDDIIIIDVRTASEFSTGYVKNAINIPLDVVEKTVMEKYPNKDEKLYLYCRSGNRSSQAAKLLVSQGYTNVYDFGGINNWPYEVVK